MTKYRKAGGASANDEKKDDFAKVDVVRENESTVFLRLSGAWKIDRAIPDFGDMENVLEKERGVKKIVFDMREVSNWDTALPAFVTGLMEHGRNRGIEIDMGGAPEGVEKLLEMAFRVPERAGARRGPTRVSLMERIGGLTVDFGKGALELFEFAGECVVAFLRLFSGKARFQGGDFLLFIQQCGADSFPIVALISLLFGLILAFVGSVQLLMFGAQLYVANLVAIAVVRVMGAVMCGVIMAGRIGAAFAAQLGTMRVNEEIDALRTLAISPMEFLVLPRMLALVTMMPLLCLFADVMGILGGLIVGTAILDISLVQYVMQTKASLNMTHVAIGLFHSVVFGVLVSLFGCFKGIKCGRSASAVGSAATSAVVSSIVAIVVSTAIITIVCNVLKI